MNFKPAEPTPNFFRRWVSEEEKWELGFTNMVFGVRVRLSRMSCGWCTIDLCGGPDLNDQWLLMAATVQYLNRFKEDVSEKEIQSNIPHYTVKPVLYDPIFWPAYQKLAFKNQT